jgi:HK97 family phage major capsid protein
MDYRTLPDLTAAMAQNKALAATADRLIGVALGEAPAIVRKANVTAVGVSDMAPLAADPEAQPLLHQAQRRSVVGRLLALGAVSVPPFRRLPPTIEEPEGAWIDAGGAIPLARVATTSLYAETKKYAFMLAFTTELLKLADPRARNLVASRSMRAIVKGDDAGFLSTSAASAAQPAGILWNRSAVGGGSPQSLADDLEDLVAVVADGDAFSPVFIVSARGAAFLNASGINAFRDVGLTGGTIAGAPAIVSRSAAHRLILVDASEIAISDEGVDVARSTNAAVQMLDNPTNNSVTPTATTLVSAFQAGATILKYVRYLSWLLLREDAVGFLELPIGGSPS